MQLTKAQTSALSGLMRLLAETTGADALREACAIHMLKLLEADQYVSMVWNAAAEQFESLLPVHGDARKTYGGILSPQQNEHRRREAVRRPPLRGCPPHDR